MKPCSYSLLKFAYLTRQGRHFVEVHPLQKKPGSATAKGSKKVCISNFELAFSNSLIIHAALNQLEHLILVRWMSLETQ